MKHLIEHYQLLKLRRGALGTNLEVKSIKFSKAASREHQDRLENRMLRLCESHEKFPFKSVSVWNT
jgi:hypothetical protein